MTSSDQDNGGHQLTGLLTQQKGISHSAEILSSLVGDRWFLEKGIWTERAADTLMGYAYMMPGVQKATLKIDLNQDNGGKSPSVLFELKMEKQFFKKHQKYKALIGQDSILSKMRLIWLLRSVSVPMAVEENLTVLCKGYLPSHYEVKVKLESV